MGLRGYILINKTNHIAYFHEPKRRKYNNFGRCVLHDVLPKTTSALFRPTLLPEKSEVCHTCSTVFALCPSAYHRSKFLYYLKC